MEAQIVGVVAGFHNNGLQEAVSPCVLLNSFQGLGRASIKINPGADLSETVLFVEQNMEENLS